MAVIHHTTLAPSKLELLAAWLPAQSWYAGGTPQLSRAGGFRLDDPDGAVGIEFLLATDAPVDEGRPARTYQVPLTYRDAPLAGADDAHIGTTEHGVLGRRWVYDGVYDPVLVAQLLDLSQGRIAAQAQSESNTPDPSVVAHAASPEPLRAGRSTVRDVDGSTEIQVETVDPSGRTGPDVRICVRRVLVPEPAATAAAGIGQVTAGWRLPDGTPARGVLVVTQAAAEA